MIKIFSMVEPDKLLHIVVEPNDFKPGRIDLIDEVNELQCALLNLNKGKTFRPHKHIWKNITHDIIAQESWVVVRGSVKVTYYDLDDTILAKLYINQGDASFTLEGGHNYEILEDDTLVYEFKTGPWLGTKLDKEFIDEV